jgi:DNA replication protein DnaC
VLSVIRKVSGLSHPRCDLSGRSLSDTAALAVIGAAARQLKLLTVRTDAARLADFSTDLIPGIAAQLATLATGAWIDAGKPVVFLGDSGTGKTYLLIGPGLAASERGRRVRYATTAQRVNELAEAADSRQLSRVVARYGRLDLLLPDELGYVRLDPRGAELLFQIITERDEKGSIGLASNLPFSEWGTVFPDPRLVAAVVDRVTFNAHIIETGTQSYRLATRARRAAREN